jgi:hypothetical protein
MFKYLKILYGACHTTIAYNLLFFIFFSEERYDAITKLWEIEKKVGPTLTMKDLEKLRDWNMIKGKKELASYRNFL